MSLTSIHIGTHLISADVCIRACGTTFKLTNVYGPSTDADKRAFLDEAIANAPPNDEKWLIIGDFNLIYQASDKNNSNLNFRLMGQFRQALNACHLKEVKLQNRKFTWSNERDDPTLVKLDRAFCNPGWELAFGNHALTALSSSLSDHCPLMLSSQNSPRRPPSFRFENFWTKMPGFQEWSLRHGTSRQRTLSRCMSSITNSSTQQGSSVPGARASSPTISCSSSWLSKSSYRWTLRKNRGLCR